jgi:hypothetical protein
LIGPGKLLLVVSQLFEVPVLVLWVGTRVGGKKKLSLYVRNIFARSHTKHQWRCSNIEASYNTRFGFLLHPDTLSSRTLET